MFKIIYEFNIIHLLKSHWTKTFFAQQIPYPVKTYLIFKIFRINHNKDKIQKTKVKSKKAISNNHKDRKGLTQRGPSVKGCLLYTSDAADEEDSVDLGGRRIIKKKKKK